MFSRIVAQAEVLFCTLFAAEFGDHSGRLCGWKPKPVPGRISRFREIERRETGISRKDTDQARKVPHDVFIRIICEFMAEHEHSENSIENSNPPAPVIENSAAATTESEETLLEKARGALSNCNWIVGECAAQWTDRYARGRGDADFGNMIGLSADQVYQRRRVWETFHDVREVYPSLKWSHFYVAINWDDASECLQWALENQATVAEMRAWRRSIHGEDLTTDPDPLALQGLDYASVSVREASQAGGGGREMGDGEDDLPFEPTGSGVGGSGESTPYAPFRKDARGSAFEQDSGPETKTGTRAPSSTELSPLRIVKRAIGGMKRLQSQLADLSEEDFQRLPPDVINQLWDTYEELGRELKRQV